MTRTESIDFFKQAHAFFSNYHQAMKTRLQGLHNGAVGDSRYVSAWLSHISCENAAHAMQSIEAFQNKTSPAWYHAWMPEQLYFFGEKPQPIDESMLRSYVAKTVDYLLRAQELLKLQRTNSDKGYYYIPVPAHKAEQDRIHALETALQSIQEKYPEEFAQAQQQKTWLTDELVQASHFVLARVTMHGLPGSGFASMMKEKAFEARNNDAVNELKALAQADDQRDTLKLVKTTSKLVGANTPSELGTSQSHLEHIPANVSGIMAQFKVFTQSQAQSSMKFSDLSETLKAEFPTPKIKLT